MKVNASAGEIKYASVSLTDSNGADLSTTTITMGLSSTATTAPVSWQAPDDSQFPALGSAIVKMLVLNTQSVGTYYVWIKMVDSPETLVFAVTNDTVVVS